MRLITDTSTLVSDKSIQLIDITPLAQTFIKKNKAQNGILIIQSQHTTAAISLNEKCSEIEKDLIHFLGKLVPPHADYAHNKVALDGRANAHSHLLKHLMSSSETLTVKEGKFLLGAWQTLFFVELDGPRSSRQIHFTFLGE